MKGQTVEGYITLKGIHRVATELEKEGKLTIQNDLFLFHNLYKIVYENRPVQVIVQNYGDQRGGRSKRISLDQIEEAVKLATKTEESLKVVINFE